MKPWAIWVGAIVLLCCLCLGSILVPVFRSAKVAALKTRHWSAAWMLSQAMAKYVSSHAGKLAGKDWRAQAEKIEPQLRGKLSGIDGDWHVGFAAVPGTLGKKLEELSPGTVLFVDYRSAMNVDILESVFDIGYAGQEGQAVAITAGQMTSGGGAKFMRSVYVGYLLGRQGATFK